MTTECKGLCEEHSSLLEHTGDIKGQLKIMIRVMFILVAGMGYSVLQNHKASLDLVKMDSRLINTERILTNVTVLHETRLADVEEEVSIYSTLCCGELDKYRSE